jgi:hypothetical protein
VLSYSLYLRSPKPDLEEKLEALIQVFIIVIPLVPLVMTAIFGLATIVVTLLPINGDINEAITED